MTSPNSVFEISGQWENELLWCPSQCYLEVWIEDTPFVIYLRWRHEDPWTMAIIEGVTLVDFVMNGNGVWIEIEDFLPFTRFHTMELIQKYAIEAAEQYFTSN